MECKTICVKTAQGTITRSASTTKDKSEKQHRSNSSREDRSKPGLGSNRDSPQRFSARRGILRTGISAKPYGTFSTRCTNHPEYELDHFCQEHETVVCTECISGHHRECYVTGVEEAAHGMCAGPKVKLILKEFRRLQELCQTRIRQLRSAVKRLKANIDNFTNYEIREQADKGHTGIEERNEEILKLVEEKISDENKLNMCQEIDTCISLALKALQNSVLSGNDGNCFVAFHTNRKYVQIYKERLNQMSVDAYEKDKESNDEGNGSSKVDSKSKTTTAQLNQTETGDQRKSTTGIVWCKNESRKAPMSGSMRNMKHDITWNSVRSTQLVSNYQVSITETGQRDTHKNREGTSKSIRKASPNVRLMSGKTRTSAKGGRGQGTITNHFRELERLFSELDRSDLKTGNTEGTLKQENQRHQRSIAKNKNVLDETVGTNVEEKSHSKAPQQESDNVYRKDSSTGIRDQGMNEDKQFQGATDISVGASNSIEIKTNDFYDVEFSSMCGADEIQPLFGDSKSLSDVNEGEWDNSVGTPADTLKSNRLIFNDARYIRVQSPGQRLLSGKRLTSTERTSTKQETPYVSLPDTRLIVYQQIDTRTSTDSRRVKISAIDCMLDGRVIVCDASNRKVKLFEINGNYHSCLQMKHAPFAVTALSNVLVAVLSGLAYEHLFILHVGGELVIRKCFNTGFLCLDVASFESNIYLLCVQNYETEILIMLANGVVNTRIGIGSTSPKCIAVNSGSGVIYVTDEREGVTAIERIGARFVCCRDRSTERYHGLACDLNGHVFVTTEIPTGVHEMSRDGHYIVPLLLWKGHNYVRAMCYNSARNDLVLGFNSGEIISFAKIIDGTLLC